MNAQRKSCFLWILICTMPLKLTSETLWENYPVDFYTAMSANNNLFDKQYAQSNNTWKLIEQHYNTGMHASYNLSTVSRIPKKFHLIWLGSKIPERYHQLKALLEQLHPDCTVSLWTDKEARDYPMINRNAFTTSTNYGEKSDIWRYEILYNEGGVYMDGDFALLRSMNKLFYAFDFFTGMSQNREFEILNGLIGAIPHHPIMKACIDGIKISDGNNHHDAIMSRTGPYYFTRCFLSCLNQENLINVALPPSFFYPWPHYIHFEHDLDKIQSFIRPYSFTVHEWAASWAWWSPNFVHMAS